jgi:hypothetical protein
MLVGFELFRRLGVEWECIAWRRSVGTCNAHASLPKEIHIGDLNMADLLLETRRVEKKFTARFTAQPEKHQPGK